MRRQGKGPPLISVASSAAERCSDPGGSLMVASSVVHATLRPVLPADLSLEQWRSFDLALADLICPGGSGCTGCGERVRDACLLPMSDRDKDAETLALRHRITVLERQLGISRARFTASDVVGSRTGALRGG